MPPDPPHADGQPAFTRLLDRAAGGDRHAADELLPLVYAQLRGAAQLAMRNERSGHTLSATALVHEAYMKLVGPGRGNAGEASAGGFDGRAHFYAAAAQAMRQHLIDHARAKLAQKRGGPGEDHADRRSSPPPAHSYAEVADLAMLARPEEIVSLDAALSRLEGQDTQAAVVVRLRFFAGLSIEQTAEALGISPATVKRDWQYARAVLFKAVEDDRRTGG